MRHERGELPNLSDRGQDGRWGQINCWSGNHMLKDGVGPYRVVYR